MPSNITLTERIQIKALWDQGFKAPYIAKYLNRHKTSIYRELSKKKPDGAYDYLYANNLSSSNMSRNRYQGPDANTISLIEKKIINEQWSPEQISGWLKLHHDISVSHTWIYQYVEQDRMQGGELSNHLRIGKYTFGAREYKGKIPNRTTIDQRPKVINERQRTGDYEIDLVVGPKNKGAILTAVDRSSRICKLAKLKSKEAEVVKEKTIDTFNAGNILSITSDNGNEFMQHEEISNQLGIKYYFANPYASYERGSIENLNGLIRQYIPKGISFDEITEELIDQIQHKLNNRPRKVLGFLTPLEFNDKMINNKSTKLRLQV